jgi:hypothetical protein
MFTVSFWLGMLDRAIKTGASTALVLLVSSGPLNLFSVHWVDILGMTGGTVLISVLTSLASSQVGERGTTSMIRGAR